VQLLANKCALCGENRGSPTGEKLCSLFYHSQLEVLFVYINAKRTSREILRDYIGRIACKGDATTGLIGALYKRHKIRTKLPSVRNL